MSVAVDEVREQYARAWKMMSALIERTSDEGWRSESGSMMAPARAALHAIETTDFYLRASMEGFAWGARFSVDWESAIERLPGRSAMQTYANDVASRTDSWMAGLSEEDALSENAFQWTGRTTLGRIVYNLRHLVYHMGEMSAALRSAGADETPWA